MDDELLQAAKLLYGELEAENGAASGNGSAAMDFDLFLSLLEARGWPELPPETQVVSDAQRFLLRYSPDAVSRFTAAYSSVQRLGVLRSPCSILLVLLRLAEERRERTGARLGSTPGPAVAGGRGRPSAPRASDWLSAANLGGGETHPAAPRTVARGPEDSHLSAPQLARQSLRDILMQDLGDTLTRRGALTPAGNLPREAYASQYPPGGAAAADAGAIAGQPAARPSRPQYLDSYFPESAIVSDLLLILQGLPGRNFVLVKSEASGMWEFAARGDACALPSHLVHCQRIADCGALFLRVQELLSYNSPAGDAGAPRPSGGRHEAGRSGIQASGTRTGTLAAFCDALEKELNVYKRRVADLEWYSVGGGMGSTFSLSSRGSPDPARTSGSGQLSLDELLSISNLLRKEIYSLCFLADACLSHKTVRGIGILRVLYTFAQNGDSHLASLAGRLLSASILPLVQHIRRWVLTGEIFDVHHEFFIRAASDDAVGKDGDRRGQANSGAASPSENSAFVLRKSSSNYFTSFCLWVGPEASPYPLLTDEEAKVFFDAGRSAAFLRVACQDHAFQIAGDADIAELDAISAGLLQVERKLVVATLPCRSALSRLASLSAKVLKASSSRALELLFDKYHLLDHFDGLLRCLLGKQGDFTLALLSAFSAAGVGPGMVQKATGLYSLSANNLLDGAVAASNASLLPKYVQESLVIRLPGEKADSSRAPWATPELLDSSAPFTLSYNAARPLDTVITPYAVSVYEKAFRMLYSLHCCGAALDGVGAAIASFHREGLQANFGRPLRKDQASETAMGAIGNPAVAKAARMFMKKASLARSRFQLVTRSILTFACHEVIDKVYTPLLGLRPAELCGESRGAVSLDQAQASGSETGLEELLVRHEEALLRLCYGLMLEGFVHKEVRGYNYYAGAPGAQGATGAGSVRKGANAQGAPARGVVVENTAFSRFQLSIRRLLPLALRLGEAVEGTLHGLRAANILEATASLEQGTRLVAALDSDLAGEADEMCQCLERSVNLQVRGMDFQAFASLADDLRACVGGRRLRSETE